MQMGVGHFMRCLGLAQAWTKGKIVFIFARQSRNALLEKRLRAEGMNFVYIHAQPATLDDAKKTADLVSKNAWLVIDGYHFKGTYQQALKDRLERLMCFDDHGHAHRYCADLVLNQDICASKSFYRNKLKKTKMLLGTKYIVLRKDFLKMRVLKRQIPDIVRKVLVVMGGSDSSNVTLKVIKGLMRTDTKNREVVIVIGPSNPHGAILKEAIKVKGKKFKLVRNVSNMPTLMAWADLCISAGGSTCWELAFMGLPTLMVIANQTQVGSTERLHKAGIVKNLGRQSQVSVEQITQAVESISANRNLRRRMSSKGQKLVDGQGVNRVLKAMTL